MLKIILVTIDEGFVVNVDHRAVSLNMQITVIVSAYVNRSSQRQLAELLYQLLDGHTVFVKAF